MRGHAERGLEHAELLLRIVERLIELRHLGVDLVLLLHLLRRAGGLQHVEVGDVRLVHRVAGIRQPLRGDDVGVDLRLVGLLVRGVRGEGAVDVAGRRRLRLIEVGLLFNCATIWPMFIAP